VLELDPKNLGALHYLGTIHSERGETAIAREYFEHILALDPGDREIRSRMEDVTQLAPRGRTTRVAPSQATPVTPTPAAPLDVKPADVENTPADEDPVLLPDVEDEEFEGAPITLRDDSVTSDEIATMTLADIYASQGYTTRALRIYRDVFTRQPGNRALAAKIEKLEKEEAAAKPVAKPTPEPRAERVRKEPPPRASRALDAEAPTPAPSPAPTGHPIDQTRSYEQFKRWLKASNR
jgi:tetratricopeptide (TPR) repeat protein